MILVRYKQKPNVPRTQGLRQSTMRNCCVLPRPSRWHFKYLWHHSPWKIRRRREKPTMGVSAAPWRSLCWTRRCNASEARLLEFIHKNHPSQSQILRQGSEVQPKRPDIYAEMTNPLQELMHERLCTGVYNKDLREILLRHYKGGKTPYTFEEQLARAKSWELEAAHNTNITIMHSATSKVEEQVNWLTNKPPLPQIKCGWCGGARHPRKDCPASKPGTSCNNCYMTENHLAKVCRSPKDKFKADFERKHTKPNKHPPQSMDRMSTSSQRTPLHLHPTCVMVMTTSCTPSPCLPITMATICKRTINTLLGLLFLLVPVRP